MSQDAEEYEFYERRRLKEKIAKSPSSKRDFLLGERTVAKNRMERLQEEINKMNALIKLVKVMEKELDE